jgi:hypothetical protein
LQRWWNNLYANERLRDGVKNKNKHPLLDKESNVSLKVCAKLGRLFFLGYCPTETNRGESGIMVAENVTHKKVVHPPSSVGETIFQFGKFLKKNDDLGCVGSNDTTPPPTPPPS